MVTSTRTETNRVMPSVSITSKRGEEYFCYVQPHYILYPTIFFSKFFFHQHPESCNGSAGYAAQTHRLCVFLRPSYCVLTFNEDASFLVCLFCFFFFFKMHETDRGNEREREICQSGFVRKESDYSAIWHVVCGGWGGGGSHMCYYRNESGANERKGNGGFRRYVCVIIRKGKKKKTWP